MHAAGQTIAVLTALLALCACAYYLLCLWSARNFLGERARAADSSASFTPPVSILKPLRGTDPEMYECLRSHCVQDYPEYQLIFGVSLAEDPAAELVKRLQQEFPQRGIRLVVCTERLGANTKVSNLAQMLPFARHAYLIVNDSDIRVEPDYLRRVLSPLSDAKVGMVTCLYRGMAGATLGSRLEAAGISTDFAAGVLAARQLEGIRFGMGSTLAFSQRALEAIGGFEPLVDYLADDFELGFRIARRGWEVRLSDVLVETYLPHYDLRGFLEHQLRWARTVRDSRPGGYSGMVLTFGLPWALLTLLVSGGAAWGWILFAATVSLRLGLAVTVGGVVLRDRQLFSNLWLLPLRDLIALVVWAAAYAGHTIAWRGDQFILEKGKLRPA